MVIDPLTVPNLTVTGCRTRQQRLRNILADRGLDAALICDRRHVYYFIGFWCQTCYTPLALIQRDGPTIVSVPHLGSEDLAADQVLEYQSNRIGTLVEDQWGAALKPLIAHLSNYEQLGTDSPLPLNDWRGASGADIRSAIWSLRRTKDQDEVELLRCAVAATEAAYQYAFDHLQPGVTEVSLFAGMQAAIAEILGESVGEFGNDFQIGSPGGPPRRRAAQFSEIAVLDLSVVVRGYASDLSRSFVVGRRPTDLQMAAFTQVSAVLSAVEKASAPGIRCSDLYRLASDMLEGHQGWTFGHHLGHGIGLSAHETPRLNPNWNDTLQVGDVYTVEPGLYGENLRAGLRIEQDFVLTTAGPVALSRFPIDLA